MRNHTEKLYQTYFLKHAIRTTLTKLKKIQLNDTFRFEKELLQIYYSFIDGNSHI